MADKTYHNMLALNGKTLNVMTGIRCRNQGAIAGRLITAGNTCNDLYMAAGQ